MIAVALLIVGAGGYAYYLFNMPHRDVQSISSDYSLTASSIVREYLDNSKSANQKYLDEEGESKILEVSGVVASITEDFNQQKVILLKKTSDKAGVSCTFLKQTGIDFSLIKEGESIIVKGVIRSGASYDEDLEMYENVIMEKCDVVSK